MDTSWCPTPHHLHPSTLPTRLGLVCICGHILVSTPHPPHTRPHPTRPTDRARPDVYLWTHLGVQNPTPTPHHHPTPSTRLGLVCICGHTLVSNTPNPTDKARPGVYLWTHPGVQHPPTLPRKLGRACICGHSHLQHPPTLPTRLGLVYICGHILVSNSLPPPYRQG